VNVMKIATRRRWLTLAVAAAALVLGASGARAQDNSDGAAAEHAPEVHESFKEFCLVWMGKLVERERFNKTQIKWRPAAAGVEGEYIGYSSEHTCDLRPPGASGVPVGRLTYREMVYRKKGDSAEAAGANDAEVVEITEITEIFRREKGKWLY
jgi:hypothetical protein